MRNRRARGSPIARLPELAPGRGKEDRAKGEADGHGPWLHNRSVPAPSLRARRRGTSARDDKARSSSHLTVRKSCSCLSPILSRRCRHTIGASHDCVPGKNPDTGPGDPPGPGDVPVQAELGRLGCFRGREASARPLCDQNRRSLDRLHIQQYRDAPAVSQFGRLRNGSGGKLRKPEIESSAVRHTEDRSRRRARQCLPPPGRREELDHTAPRVERPARRIKLGRPRTPRARRRARPARWRWRTW